MRVRAVVSLFPEAKKGHTGEYPDEADNEVRGSERLDGRQRDRGAGNKQEEGRKGGVTVKGAETTESDNRTAAVWSSHLSPTPNRGPAPLAL